MKMLFSLNNQEELVLEFEVGADYHMGFPIQFRALPYGTFKLLFNAIFYAGT